MAVDQDKLNEFMGKAVSKEPRPSGRGFLEEV